MRTNQKFIESLNVELDKFKPAIQARHSEMIVKQFNRLIENFGPVMKGVDRTSSYMTWLELKANCKRTPTGPVVEGERVFSAGPVNFGNWVEPGQRTWETWTWEIDKDKLERNSGLYADCVLNSWKGKIAGKLQDLEDLGVSRLSYDGCSFVINGMRGGKKVNIEQNVVMNVSPKGRLFHQFPARIYVEGKFVPEKKYKEIFKQAQ